MPSKKSNKSQIKNTRRNIVRLQKMGLMHKVDLRRKPDKKTARKLRDFADLLSGKATALKIPKGQKKGLRDKVKVRGDYAIIPKQKGEKIKFTKGGEIISTRSLGSSKITKRWNQNVEKVPEIKGARTYYTIPMARGKKKVERRTFSKFDELLSFMAAYEFKFEDWEKYIEVETVEAGSAKAKKLSKRVKRERSRRAWKRRADRDAET